MRRGMVATGMAAMALAIAAGGCKAPGEGRTEPVAALYGPPPAEAPSTAAVSEEGGLGRADEAFDDAAGMRYDADAGGTAEGRQP